MTATGAQAQRHASLRRRPEHSLYYDHKMVRDRGYFALSKS
jgi:hypothetical protein